MNFTRTLIAAALVTIGSSAIAQATINQNVALAGNVTPGDTAGFPVTLSQPGSYKLTGNLFVPQGLNGIQITAPNVTLDLNGFSIIGTGVCKASGPPTVVTCTTTPTGKGVYAISTAGNATVRRGTVQGFAWGVDMEAAGTVEDITAISNTNGVAVGSAVPLDSSELSRVTGVKASNNLKIGIALVGGGGTLENSLSSFNGTFGVQLGTTSTHWTAFNVHATRNGGFGVISVGFASGHAVRSASNGANGTSNFSLFMSMGNNLNNLTQF